MSAAAPPVRPSAPAGEGLPAPAAPAPPAARPARTVRPSLLALLALLAAGALSLALRRWSPLPPGDPFRGTLVLLPLLLAGFALLRRHVERSGGRPLGRTGTAAELAALAVLVLLVLSRTNLGLPYLEEGLAAGLVLVLGHRVARQLLAARPLLGTTLPDRPPAAFFVLPLLAYLALLPWSSHHHQPDGDEPYYLLITHSLAYDLDAELTDEYAGGAWRTFLDRPLAPQPGDPVGPRGQLYSRHNELLPLALVPAYRLGGRAGALATMAAFAAALAWVTLRLARHTALSRPGEGLAAYALVAFAPPLLLYSYQVWVEVPAALLTALALDRILELEKGGTSRGWREWLGIGLPVLLLPLLKIRLMLLAAPLLALYAWRAGRRRREVWVLAVLLLAVSGGILLHNSLLYSNPLKIHSWQELDLHSYAPASYAVGALGLLWDSAFGLFACAPLWLLLLPALLVAVRRPRQLAGLLLLIVPYLVVVAPRSEWYGGWSPPFRYPLVALPLLGLALVPVLAARRGPGARALLAGLGAATLVLTLIWIAVPGWTYNFADGRSDLLDGLGLRLGADVARLFPSSVRPRAATWLWPAATLLLVPLLWWLPGRRPGGPARGREGPQLWGIAALLLLSAALPLAASRLPTGVIEAEDPQVAKGGGHLHPDRWVVDRPRFRGGWILRVGEQASAPVVPGGGEVRITLVAQLIRNQPVPFEVEVAAGAHRLAIWRPARERVWERVELGPFPWPEGGVPLVLRAHGPHPPGALNGALIDRVELDWR